MFFFGLQLRQSTSDALWINMSEILKQSWPFSRPQTLLRPVRSTAEAKVTSHNPCSPSISGASLCELMIDESCYCSLQIRWPTVRVSVFLWWPHREIRTGGWRRMQYGLSCWVHANLWRTLAEFRVWNRLPRYVRWCVSDRREDGS